MNWNFQKNKPFFVLDPEGGEVSYFETIEAANQFANECIKEYLDPDNIWSDEVVNVVAGKITHSAQQTDRVDRPEDIDKDDIDGEGDWWPPDCEYRCSYKLLPIDT